MEERTIKELLEVAQIDKVDITWQQNSYVALRKKLYDELEAFSSFLKSEDVFNFSDLCKLANALYQY